VAAPVSSQLLYRFKVQSHATQCRCGTSNSITIRQSNLNQLFALLSFINRDVHPVFTARAFGVMQIINLLSCYVQKGTDLINSLNIMHHAYDMKRVHSLEVTTATRTSHKHRYRRHMLAPNISTLYKYSQIAKNAPKFSKAPVEPF